MNKADPRDPAECLAFAMQLVASTPACRAWGVRVSDAAPGHCILKMRVDETMLNGLGHAHGGMIFALADTAFALAANTPDRDVVTQYASISFLGSASEGEELVASASLTARAGRTQTFAVHVEGAGGRTVALLHIAGREIR